MHCPFKFLYWHWEVRCGGGGKKGGGDSDSGSDEDSDSGEDEDEDEDSDEDEDDDDDDDDELSAEDYSDDSENASVLSDSPRKPRTIKQVAIPPGLDAELRATLDGKYPADRPVVVLMPCEEIEIHLVRASSGAHPPSE